jgi:hypothetical protein
MMTVLALFFTGAATAYSAGSLDQWVAEMNGMLSVKQKSITFITDLRDSRCPVQATAANQDVCRAAFNVGILRRKAEQAEVELWLKSLGLNQADRDRLFKDITPVPEYNQRDLRTTLYLRQILEMFPARSAQR